MKVSYRLVIIASIFVTCLITSNILIVKQIAVGNIILPAAIIIFPVGYIFGDVLTEVYGYSQARRVIWLGFGCNLIAVAAFWIGGLLPAAAPFVDKQPAYEAILGSTPRFLAASFLAYLAGEFTNSFVLARMKVATRGRWLWSRTIASTAVGQAVDTLVVLVVAFLGTLPLGILIPMLTWHWAAKVAYEVAATPATYRIVSYLKRKEGLDVYDYSTDFNPLRVA